MLYSDVVQERILPFLTSYARQIELAFGVPAGSRGIASSLFRAWTSAISRICIGIRRAGTGGALLITPSPNKKRVDVKNRLPYKRLSHSMILGVLDNAYSSIVQDKLLSLDSIPFEDFAEDSGAEADRQDRAQELTGAIKLVSSLATVDGLVLLTPALEVVGFGAKLTASSEIGDVFAGRDPLRNARQPRLCDVSRFGTRHGSMLRYCKGDPHGIGVVVSQDGSVRIIVNTGSKMWLCDDVLLLAHRQDLSGWIRDRTEHQKNKAADDAPFELGYTSMPKTIDELMRMSKTIAARMRLRQR